MIEHLPRIHGDESITTVWIFWNKKSAPVHTGMNPCFAEQIRELSHLPRIYGDEPITSTLFAPQRKPTPYARGVYPILPTRLSVGINPACAGVSSSQCYRSKIYHFWSILTKKCYPQKYGCLKWYILVLLRKSKAKGNKGLPSMETSPRDLVFAPHTRGWTPQNTFLLQIVTICPVYAGMNLSISGTPDKDMASAPYTRGWTHFLITSGLIINDLPRIHGNEFATPQLPKYVSFLANIDQKTLSTKICPAKMMHTGSVAEVQDDKTAC